MAVQQHQHTCHLAIHAADAPASHPHRHHSPSKPTAPPMLTRPRGRQFTESALSLSQTLLNAAIDLVSFSGILYTIYPPLFVVLVVYSVGGTAISLRLGRPLVSLNFQQEAQEANLR